MATSSRHTPVTDPAPAPRTEEHPGERIFGSSVEGDLSVIDEKKGEMSKLLDQIQEQLNKQAIEIELKEKSIIERLRVVEIREREIESKLSVETRLGVEKAMKELEDKEKEVELLSKLNYEKSYQLELKMEKFDVKQRVAAERKRLDDEQLETREKDLKEKAEEIETRTKFLEEKAKELELKQKQRDSVKESVQAEILSIARRRIEAEVLIKELEAREKELDEKEEILKAKAEETEEKFKELELKQKQRDLGEGSVQKRSRVESLAEKGSEAAKRHRHGDENKETESSSEEEPNGEDIEEQEEEDVATTEPVPITSVESEFNDFKKTINSFEVGQFWALYDPIDAMPRLYGRIKTVIKSRSCIRVRWVNPKDEQETISVACGRFKYGILETKDHSAFSHEMSRNIRGHNYIAVYPRRGEIWAMFKDWSKNYHQLHKQPYTYDFFEILLDFDENFGVLGVYLEKVDGFISVFKYAGQEELTVPPSEMNRFSHRVPSFKLTGEKKQGVPFGSFELDPAAIPSSIRVKQVKEETETQSDEFVEDNQDGSTKDVLIILD